MHVSLLDAVKLAVSPPDCGDQVDQVGPLKHEAMSQTHQDLAESDRSRFGQGFEGRRKNWGNMQYSKKTHIAIQGGRSKWCLSSTQMDISIGC